MAADRQNLSESFRRHVPIVYREISNTAAIEPQVRCPQNSNCVKVSVRRPFHRRIRRTALCRRARRTQPS